MAQYNRTSPKLLCTFSEVEELSETIDLIRKTYNILYDKIFVFRVDSLTRVVITYNIDPINLTENTLIPNTIVVNRNKLTNTLYTVNAFKSIAGNKPTIDWNKYRSCLLVTEDDSIKIYKISILNIIHL